MLYVKKQLNINEGDAATVYGFVREVDNTVLNARISYIEQQVDLSSAEIYDANNNAIKFDTMNDVIQFLKDKEINTTNVCNKVLVKRE